MTHRAYTYLDHAATTPPRREVVEAMTACMEDDYGNPSSAHGPGRRARRRLEEARSGVARALNAEASAVIFVRGGTEGDNLAVLGWARRQAAAGITPKIVTTSVEHPAVREAAGRVAAEGGVHVVIPVDPEAGLDLDALDAALAEGSALVSCMWVNNEVGITLPVTQAAQRARAAGSVCHTDAVQAVGKVPVLLDEVPVDLLTVTGHKIYGPRGTGALIARDPGDLSPIHWGGGQERGLRPGTEDVAGAVGLATALTLAVAEQALESERLQAIRDGVAARLKAWDPGVRVNGEALPRAPHILSLGIPEADADTLLATLDLAGFAASGGSACASGSAGPASSVQALYGTSDELTTLRLSFGRATQADDVERIAQGVAAACERVRSLAVA